MTIRDSEGLVAALLGLEGVAGASIEGSGVGPGTLRLRLDAGTDQVIVAGEVNDLLRARFGLAVDPDRFRVVDQTPTPLADFPLSAAKLGRHAVVDSAMDESLDALDINSDIDTDAASRAAAVRQPAAPTPAIGAYARDALGVATVITTDLQIANGVEHPAVPEITLARPSRLSIERVQLVSAGLGAEVTVTLGLDGRDLEGSAEGAATQTGLLRSVATATLRAVERITDGTARFEVEHVEVARTGTDQTVLVVITMLTGRSAQRLSGASVVREDTREAVIRAVLAAVNRRMEPLLAER